MPMYIVKGLNAAGRSQSAQVKADSPDHARDRAQRAGLAVQSVELDLTHLGGDDPSRPASTPVVTSPSIPAQPAGREAEKTLYTARGTWLAMIVPLVLCSLWLIFTAVAIASKVPAAMAIIGGIQVLLVIRCLWLFLLWKSTTLSVTTRRVVGRQGVLSRAEISLLHHKIESFSVHQGLLGRMLGFGTINIAGSGQGRVSFTGIEKPVVLRRYIEEAVETARHASQAAPQIVYIQAPTAAAAT